MTGGEVLYTVRARNDLVRLALWIAMDGGEARAKDQIDRIKATLMRLARRPQLGPPDVTAREERRVFSARPWKILYRPLPNDAGIHVPRILDSRQDIPALLGKKT